MDYVFLFSQCKIQYGTDCTICFAYFRLDYAGFVFRAYSFGSGYDADNINCASVGFMQRQRRLMQ